MSPQVESWMTAVEEEMKRSLRSITKEGVFHYAQVRGRQYTDQSHGTYYPLGLADPTPLPTQASAHPQVQVAPVSLPGAAACADCCLCCWSQAERTEWLKGVLGMVSLVGSQIWWTWEVEDVFRR